MISAWGKLRGSGFELSGQMLKDVVEILKTLLEFLRSLKVVFTVFLSSALWLLPPIRNLFPVPKALVDNVNVAASIGLLLSFAYLLASAFVPLYQRWQEWRQSEGRKLRKSLTQASPIEKHMLQAVIQKGEYLIELDAGSPIAMRLQEIGLIARAHGLPYTTYQLANGLADLCIRAPSLLHLPKQQEDAALSELEQWKKNGSHKSFLRQLSGPHNDWMA